LRHYGYVCKRIEGSHHQYAGAEKDVITIVGKGQIKKAYVIDILKRIGEK